LNFGNSGLPSAGRRLKTAVGTAPTQEQIALAVAFALKEQEISIVYIHCKAVRPSMIVRPEARRAIQVFHQGLRETRSPTHLVANTTHRADWEAA